MKAYLSISWYTGATRLYERTEAETREPGNAQFPTQYPRNWRYGSFFLLHYNGYDRKMKAIIGRGSEWSVEDGGGDNKSTCLKIFLLMPMGVIVTKFVIFRR